jgi:hypothetical protein
VPKKLGRQVWILTREVSDVIQKWESFRPSGMQPDRLQSVEFTNLARSCMVKMLDEAGAKSTCNQIAHRLNDPNTVGHRFPGSRKYNRLDVQREVKRLFPPAMDVAQTCDFLRDLQSIPGWKGLGVEIGVKHCETMCVHLCVNVNAL